MRGALTSVWCAFLKPHHLRLTFCVYSFCLSHLSSPNLPIATLFAIFYFPVSSLGIFMFCLCGSHLVLRCVLDTYICMPLSLCDVLSFA